MYINLDVLKPAEIQSAEDSLNTPTSCVKLSIARL